jgi:hypothetical protein
MAYPQKADTRQLAREQRRARLEAELRSNLRKRKDQARSRLQVAPGAQNGGDQPDAWEAASAEERGPTGEVA